MTGGMGPISCAYTWSHTCTQGRKEGTSLAVYTRPFFNTRPIRAAFQVDRLSSHPAGCGSLQGTFTMSLIGASSMVKHSLTKVSTMMRTASTQALSRAPHCASQRDQFCPSPRRWGFGSHHINNLSATCLGSVAILDESPIRASTKKGIIPVRQAQAAVAGWHVKCRHHGSSRATENAMGHPRSRPALG